MAYLWHIKCNSITVVHDWSILSCPCSIILSGGMQFLAALQLSSFLLKTTLTRLNQNPRLPVTFFFPSQWFLCRSHWPGIWVLRFSCLCNTVWQQGAALMRTCWGLLVRPLLRRDTGEPSRVVVTPTCPLRFSSFYAPPPPRLASRASIYILPILWWRIHTFCLSYDRMMPQP